MRIAPVVLAGLAVLLALLVLVPAWVRAETPALLLPGALGRTDRVWVFGRVLREAYGEHGPAPFRTGRVLTGRNRPGARVEVRFLGLVGQAVSGHDGEFEVEIEAPREQPFPPGRHQAEVRAVVGPAGREREVVGRATVEVVAPEAPFLLVSDFDDTVAVTNVTEKRKLLASVLLQNGETQPAVPGMAKLYRCLTGGGAPLAIVSGSPAQLAPRVSRFLEKNGFPPAALFLRNMGADTLSHYKEPVLARLALRFPGLPFVLVGDSGEHDPEIFAAFIKANPGRVLRAYVRKATATPGPAARFEGMLLFAEPGQVEADAVARGIVGEACRAGP